MDVDAVIAQATKEQDAAEPEASEEATPDIDDNQSEATEPKQDEEAEESADLKDKADDELTEKQLEKREANRKSHLNSKLARMRRENRELKQRLEQASEAQVPAKKQTGEAPKEEDFETYAEFLDAKADWKIEQKFSERDIKNNEVNQVQQANAAIEQRIGELSRQEHKFATENPEYEALYEEHADFMDNMPPEVGQALLEAENGVLAIYALMKEGNLESLEGMTPARIAMEIGKAELRGESYLGQDNTVTNAPKPLKPAKGGGSPEKSLADKSVEELMKQFND